MKPQMTMIELTDIRQVWLCPVCPPDVGCLWHALGDGFTRDEPWVMEQIEGWVEDHERVVHGIEAG